MSFLGLAGKRYLVFGVANKRSVAYQIGRILEAEGATVIYSVRSEARRESTAKLLEGRPVHVCDVEDAEQIRSLRDAVDTRLDGIVHSVAFASYEAGAQPFEAVSRQDFLQAMQISCHSLLEISDVFRPQLAKNASVVTISISTTKMAAENYGYMAPVKAALDASVVFLAKSFAATGVRFNAVCAGLLKTSASAGIPGYVDSYLFAERAILRKEALRTEEVANTAAFLLSPRSSGINAQGVVVDAGMGVNYFDRTIVEKASR